MFKKIKFAVTLIQLKVYIIFFLYLNIKVYYSAIHKKRFLKYFVTIDIPFIYIIIQYKNEKNNERNENVCFAPKSNYSNYFKQLFKK